MIVKLMITHSLLLQLDETQRGTLGFGGTTPCGQTAGKKIFYSAFENPRDLLINGEYRHIPVFFGANSHEGSYVLTGTTEVPTYSDHANKNSDKVWQ